MHWTLLLVVLALSTVHCYGGGQIQMPVAAELNEPDDDLQAQIRALQKNVSDVWTYIYQLRSAVSNHLTHLRQHQVELENSMHTMEHLHESELRSMGHHSGEQHSHSGEQHSHSGEQHSHSGEQHSHSGEHHSHSGEHGHHSYSYSHSSHDHSKEDHHHHHDHKDSHENEDVQTRDGLRPPAEAVAAPTYTQEHHHHGMHEPPVSSAVASPVIRDHHHHESVSVRPPAGVTQEHSHQGVNGPPAQDPTRHYHHQHGSPDGMNLMNEPFHRHHHHHHGSRSRNRTVELPKYSDYGQYDLALCRVEPNRALPENQQQDIMGTITMWQKKTGGPLNFHIRLQGFDVGHGDHHGHQVQQEQDNEAATSPIGHRHGFHIHASGDLSNGCQSAGPHYNPKGVNHGSPHGLVRHVGDLGNIECDEHGNANIMFSDDVASLRGQYSVVGKAIVIHAKEDDLGLGGDAESLRTGNAGTRLACCVIQNVEKIPIRQYKAMKSATQYQNR